MLNKAKIENKIKIIYFFFFFFCFILFLFTLALYLKVFFLILCLYFAALLGLKVKEEASARSDNPISLALAASLGRSRRPEQWLGLWQSRGEI